MEEGKKKKILRLDELDDALGHNFGDAPVKPSVTSHPAELDTKPIISKAEEAEAAVIAVIAPRRARVVATASLIPRLARKVRYSQTTVRDILKSYHELVLAELKKGNTVRFGGLGTLRVVEKVVPSGFESSGRVVGTKLVKVIKFKQFPSMKKAFKSQ